MSRLNDFCDENGLLQVVVHPVALGERHDSADLRVMKSGGGAYASFTASWIKDGTVTVDVRTLDESLPRNESISLIKIDVEGHELPLLRGACQTLEKHGPLLYVEVNHLILKDAGSSGAEFIDTAAREFGYVVMPQYLRLMSDATTGMANLLMCPAN